MTEGQQFRPPVLVGERVAWLGSGSGMPQSAIVRWIGRIPEITQGWTVGIELDAPMPVGGIDGTWRKRQLFSCKPKRGLLVPVDKIMKESSLLKTRHSLGEAFYEVSPKKQNSHNQDLIRKLSLPQSASSQEFLAKVLPQSEKCRPPVVDSEIALNFKQAAVSVLNQVSSVEASQVISNGLSKTSTPTSTPAPLTVANVKAFDVEVRSRNEHRKKTLEELEKFKKHLDEWENLKHNSLHRSKKKKVGENPESLYSLAQTATDYDQPLFLRVIGEKTNLKGSHVDKDDQDRLKKYRSTQETRKVSVKSVILEEKIDDLDDPCVVGNSSLVNGKTINKFNEKNTAHSACSPVVNKKTSDDTGTTCGEESVDVTRSTTFKSSTKLLKDDQSDERKKELQVQVALEENILNEEEYLTNIQPESFVWETLTEETEPEFCLERVGFFENNPATRICPPQTLTDQDCDAKSVSGPTPTTRKKRHPPVPAPRRRSCDGPRQGNASFESDTTSVLYEPAFLTEYLRAEQSPAMTDIRGTFRRLDDDEIDRSPGNLQQPSRRPLTASVSVPAPPRKSIFSFFKWFKKDKPRNDLDLEDFNAPSMAGSPLFTRSRLANANSVDTLYSIATVSSFAFVSGVQYQNVFGSDKRKKRRAPPPPPLRRDRGDTSLPNTLDSRVKQRHRRSVSESYKDRRSGAFAHVQGKRKAPAPPKERLYPSLSSMKDDSLTKKKRPAPTPPAGEKATNSCASVVEDKPIQICSNVVEIVTSDVVVEHEPDEEIIVPVAVKDENVVCNDTLRLERGVLKPNKILAPSSPVSNPAPISPVSPRPWYKRKSLEKRKERFSDDWMPEIGIPRPLASPDPSPLRFNFFSKSDDKKKEEKRRSGLTLLANISELDREAAEICRKEQEQKLRLLAANDAKYYTDSPPAPEPDVPKRSSTRELITLFNSIGSARDTEDKLSVAVSDKPDIKSASVVDTKTKCIVVENTPADASPSRVQILFDQRQRHHSPSPSISTITEISEPSSSAATLNQNDERVWTCTRCTLENLNWKNRCDACSACKPNYNPKKMERRKSEMELEIDWEKELEKYFPTKNSFTETVEEITKVSSSFSEDITQSKETGSETKQEKDVREKETTDPKEGDLDEIRKKRIAFFMKSLGMKGGQETSVRDAAAKKSLDEAEKMKLKEMLKEMKNSLPKYEAAKNRGRIVNEARRERLPDVALNDGYNSSSQLESVDSNKSAEDAAKYGAIPKTRREDNGAEALLLTTTTVFEDVVVKKRTVSQKNDPSISFSVSNFSTEKNDDGSYKPTSAGNGPFELMRVRDLANIIESKTHSPYPSHIYANYPRSKDSDSSTNESSSNDNCGREVARLATQLTRASGVAEFRASLEGTGANTLAVNRLLRRLEAAIAAGRHDQAATLARELAGLKVNCSVVRQKTSPGPSPVPITVEMYVEDKVSHQGPIPLRVQPSMSVSDLKLKVQKELHIPCHVQRWILGKQLATEDFRTLEELGVTMDKCPVFLYLVAPEAETVVSGIAPSAPEEDMAAAGPLNESDKTPAAPMGKGWYYNYEEDRYSFCESDSDNSSSEKEPKHGDVAQNSNGLITDASIEVKSSNENGFNVSEKESISRNNSFSPNEKILSNLPPPSSAILHITEKYSETSTPMETKNSKTEDSMKSSQKKLRLIRPPLKPSASLPEEMGRPLQVTDNKNSDTAAGSTKATSKSPEKKNEPSRSRSRSIFDLIKPQANDTLKKDLKVISVNAVKETIEKLTRRTEDVQRNGWRCELCTLVNEVGRATCGACTAPRPPGYLPPVASPAEEELRRLRRNQDIDLPALEPNGKTHYLELVGLDYADLVVNQDPFDCPVCLMPQHKGEGVVLRECLHTFCRGCLAMTIEHGEEAEVKCPYRDDHYSCDSVLQQREIKALVPLAVFEQHLARGVAQAENRMGNAFHCKTPDCNGWCVLDDNVNHFTCPVCSTVNCLTCRAIHQGMDCRAYQDRLKSSSDTNADAKRTRTMLEEMVQKGDAMACPTCQVVLMKKWGCDWLRCSMCKTEICWVTRGPRWGPNGKGDTSAGCQCGVNGVKCHPKCNYCH